MKKICLITTTSLTQKVFVVETAKYLQKKMGCDVTLICDIDKGFGESLPKEIHYIPVKMARGFDLNAINSIIKLARVFRKEKFDLVQYSTPNASCYASIAAKLVGVPIRLYCQWGIRYVDMKAIQRIFFKSIEKLVCVNSTNIRAASPLNMLFAIREGLYKKNKAKVIGQGGTIGVDIQKFNIEKKRDYCMMIRQKYSINKEDFVFGYSGRVTVDKGCSELLLAFKEIARCYSNAKLFLVGPEEKQKGIQQELYEWAKKSSQVIFTGIIDREKMSEYYSAMDVLVHPTYREGFGMVLQEAGAMGVAVVTTKIPGASEVLEEGESCILVSPKSVSELKSVMKKLISNKKQVEEIGLEAYKRVLKYYTRPYMLENQRADYEELLNK